MKFKLILGVLLVAAIALYIGSSRPGPKARPDPDRANFPKANAESEKASDQSRQEKALIKKLRGTHAELEQTQAALEATRRKEKGTALDSMLNNPAARAFMQEQQKSMVQQMLKEDYGDLANYLKVPPDQMARINGWLEEKKKAEVSLGTELLGASDEKRNEIFKTQAEKIAEIEKSLRNELDPEAEKVFDWFENSLNERKQLEHFQKSLAAEGADFPAAQLDSLLQIMTSERGRFTFTHDFYRPNFPPEVWTKENVDRFFSERKILDDRIFAQAQKLLPRDQLENFRKAQQMQFEKQKGQLMMASTVLAPRSHQNASR